MLHVFLHKKTTNTPVNHHLTFFIATVKITNKKLNLYANRKALTALYKTEWCAVVRQAS